MLILTILTIAIALYFFIKYKDLSKSIQLICKDISDNNTCPNRPIMLISNQKSIQQLLLLLNHFIDNHRELNQQNQRKKQGMQNTVTNLSHDLKTPLTVISAYAEVTRNSLKYINQEELHLNLDKIEMQSNKLIHIINDYFDLNKLDAQEMRLDSFPIDACEILREEMLTFYSEIQTLEIELVVDILEDCVFILGDKQALSRIYANLLSNAIQYGQAGKYLKIKSWISQDNLLIEITDKGKGILEENQNKIFNRLETLEDASDKNYQGSGLGLAITKSLVTNLGGDISLYSKPFVRTSFTLKFPLFK